MENIILWTLSTLAGAFTGSFLAGYLKQKGQNLATHEDIGKLVDQIRVVTQTTKEIEAKISDEVWDRQKRWELKRDLLIEMLKKTAVLRERLFRLHADSLTSKDHSSPENSRGGKARAAAADLDAAIGEYDQAKLVVDLVCGARLKGALLYYEKYINDLAGTIVEGRAGTNYAEFTAELMDKLHAVLFAVRAEIGSDPLFSNPKQRA